MGEMSKRERGDARVRSLGRMVQSLLDQDDNLFMESLKGDPFNPDGTFHRGKLAMLVGHGCVADTFRQNDALKQLMNEAQAKILERKVKGVAEKKSDEVTLTKQGIGELNETKFLAWLAGVGTVECPAPVSHTSRLYRKALWATYSGQVLLDIAKVPRWLNDRSAVKDALNELDVKVVQNAVVTVRMDSESIADDMEDSMTSALVRKLRTELKAVQEQLAAEREARLQAELAAKQNDWLAAFIPTGKMPNKQ